MSLEQLIGGCAMIFWVIGAVFLLILALSYGCYWIAFYNPVNRHHEAVIIRGKKDPQCLDALYRDMADMPFEQVYIRSFDGIRLAGRYYHRSDDAPIHIQFHGYRGNGIRDFCAAHRVCMEMGINTLVVDQRAHGDSGGNTMTFGILERSDCLCWARYAAERFGSDKEIYLCGVSMGAATVLMASALALPENVAGIIADCPYSTPGAIICKVISDMRFPVMLIYPFVALGAFVFGGFRVWEESPIHAVTRTRIPILLIHGSEDKYVPYEMSAAIYEKCAGQRYLEIFPGAGHGGSCVTDPVRYEKIIGSFMENCRKY